MSCLSYKVLGNIKQLYSRKRNETMECNVKIIDTTFAYCKLITD